MSMLVTLHCPSKSSSATFLPCFASWAATFTDIVVFPTPPLKNHTAMRMAGMAGLHK